MSVTEVKKTNNLCNINQARKDLQRRTIRLTESDHDFILYEIKCQDTIEYEIDMSVDYRED